MENRKGYWLEGDVIVINRSLTMLDGFVRDFLKVLTKYSDYLIVSGFVSIMSGRTRATEDVDVLVPIMEKARFKELFEEVCKNGFWCYQGEDAEEPYNYLKNFDSIRFARINEVFPNIEFSPINETKKAKYFEFTHPQKVRVENFEFKIPPIEFEILYKEIVLTGKKDIEDAKHLRTFFADILDKEKFKKYEKVIREAK